MFQYEDEGAHVHTVSVACILGKSKLSTLKTAKCKCVQEALQPAAEKV